MLGFLKKMARVHSGVFVKAEGTSYIRGLPVGGVIKSLIVFIHVCSDENETLLKAIKSISLTKVCFTECDDLHIIIIDTWKTEQNRMA